MPALRGVSLQVAQGEFLAVMGPVGAGKSTLCLSLNGAIPHAVDGEFSGRVVVYRQDTRDVLMGHLCMQVGLVLEDVEAQLFNATVADEVAFGLEGLGLPPDEIERRIDAALESMGLVGCRERAPRTLSGGEQKRLILASVLAMRPRLLVLDEPTAGLDPRGRRETLSAIDRLRREEGREITLVMATQDAEAVARFADRAIVLYQGRIALEGRPREVFGQIERLRGWGIAVPQLARLAKRLSEHTGRSLYFLRLEEAQQALAGLGEELFPAKSSISGNVGTATPSSLDETNTGHGDVLATESAPISGEPVSAASPRLDEGQARHRGARPATERAIEIRDLAYRYPSAEGWALSGIDLNVWRGEWLVVVGVNGSGKSTLIKHLNGLLKPADGTVCVDGLDTRTHQVGELARTVGYLSQNPDHMIFGGTVRQEVAFGPRQFGLRGAALDERVEGTLAALDLLPLADYPPAVLGYGLRRQVALASVLALHTPVLALDEPTVGLDWGLSRRLLGIVTERHRRGSTVIMITHNLRWAARHAQRVVVLYEGHLVAQGTPAEVLSDPERLAACGLEALPVTTLAHALQWPPPAPLTVDDVLARRRGG